MHRPTGKAMAQTPMEIAQSQQKWLGCHLGTSLVTAGVTMILFLCEIFALGKNT
ncbi:MAG: hypothetical protein RBS57_10545 [Desulforhabdus sp.]|jgi:hypothetical protein|nr:hypothetical protein [Desulforhabdus sp.]